jgi:hypothetical protein
MEAESSFRNAVILLFCNLDDGKSPEEQFYSQYLTGLVDNPSKEFCDILNRSSDLNSEEENVDRPNILICYEHED